MGKTIFQSKAVHYFNVIMTTNPSMDIDEAMRLASCHVGGLTDSDLTYMLNYDPILLD